MASSNGKAIVHKKTDALGFLSIEPPEYFVEGGIKTYSSPYTLVVRKKNMGVELKNNMEIDLERK